MPNLEYHKCESIMRHSSQLSIGHNMARDLKNWNRRPLLFEDENVTGSTYQRIYVRENLSLFFVSKHQDYSENLMFQQYNAPLH